MERNQEIQQITNTKNPRDLRIALTEACNYRCGFCHAEGMKAQKTDSISASQYKELRNTLKSTANLTGITLTGGEPLLHKKVLHIAETLKSTGAHITMVSNGSLLNKKHEIATYVDRINVSLHSNKEGIYQTLTNSRTSPTQIIENIQKIREQYPHLEITSNSTIIKGLNDQKSDLRTMLQLAEDHEIQLKYVELYPDSHPGRVSVKTIEKQLQELGYQEIQKTGRKKVLSNNKTKVSLCKCFCSNTKGQEHPGNHCQQHNDLFVSPQGEISICPYAPKDKILTQAILEKNEGQIHTSLQDIYDTEKFCREERSKNGK